MSHRRSLATASFLAALAITPALHAQVCIGLPSTNVAPVNIAGIYSTGNDASAFGVRVGAGNERLYGGAAFSSTSVDGFVDNGMSIGVDGGLQLAPGGSPRARFCPTASFTLTNGPNRVIGADRLELSQNTVTLGMAAGAVLPLGDNMAFTPFGHVQVVSYRLKTSFRDESVNTSEAGFHLAVGGGIRINNVFAISPFVTFPTGFDVEADPIITIMISYGIRR